MTGRFRYGWNPNLDIPSALEAAGLDGSRVVLLSMIDSTSNVADLPSLIPLLKRTGRWCRVVGSDVALRLATFNELIGEDFFFGFEELWVYSKIPQQAKPPEIRITSDVPLDAPQAGLAEWMVESECIAGLGDGDGLNYATFNGGLAALWARH